MCMQEQLNWHIYMYTCKYTCMYIPLCGWVPQTPAAAAAACGCHLPDKEERGQTVGMLHTHQRSFHCLQDRQTGGSSCAASATDGSTVHTAGQPDRESSRDVV